MNSDCPCQPYGELRESTQDFFFNLFFLFVVFIADIFPVFRLDVTFFSIIGDDVESFFYFIEAADYANSTIYPAAVEVIFDKDNLSSRFQHQLARCGQATFREISRDFTPEGNRVTG